LHKSSDFLYTNLCKNYLSLTVFLPPSFGLSSQFFTTPKQLLLSSCLASSLTGLYFQPLPFSRAAPLPALWPRPLSPLFSSIVLNKTGRAEFDRPPVSISRSLPGPLPHSPTTSLFIIHSSLFHRLYPPPRPPLSSSLLSFTDLTFSLFMQSCLHLTGNSPATHLDRSRWLSLPTAHPLTIDH
jgi:hypothetical protein